jgi:hypothetical protein
MWAPSWDFHAPDAFCTLLRRETLFDCSTIAGEDAVSVTPIAEVPASFRYVRHEPEGA